MPNMEHCIFENTSNDLQQLIDKIYEDNFHPNKLSKSERRYFDALYDQVQTLHERLDEIEEQLYDEENEETRIASILEDQDARIEEYEMHKAIVGKEQADYDFNNQYTNESIDDDYNTFRRKD